MSSTSVQRHAIDENDTDGGAQEARSAAPQSILIRRGRLRIALPVRRISFIRSEHVYVAIHFQNRRRVLHRISLTELAAQLPQDDFLRVHRSYVINAACVDSWNRDTIYIGGEEIPISRGRREEVVRRLSSNGR